MDIKPGQVWIDNDGREVTVIRHVEDDASFMLKFACLLEDGQIVSIFAPEFLDWILRDDMLAKKEAEREAERQAVAETPKIIQLIVAPAKAITGEDNWQGRLLGLDDDGAVFVAKGGQWEMAMPPMGCVVPENKGISEQEPKKPPCETENP